MRRELFVSIERDFRRRGINIYIGEDTEEKTFLAKPINLEFEEIATGTSYPPTLHIDYRIADEFLVKFADELEKKGIRTIKQEESLEKSKSTLEAVKYHLEDMRNLVFRKDKTIKKV